jgi:hypothetical protein
MVLATAQTVNVTSAMASFRRLSNHSLASSRLMDPGLHTVAICVAPDRSSWAE